MYGTHMLIVSLLCRLRRVSCDGYPSLVCSNCARRGRACVYSTWIVNLPYGTTSIQHAHDGSKTKAVRTSRRDSQTTAVVEAPVVNTRLLWEIPKKNRMTRISNTVQQNFEYYSKVTLPDLLQAGSLSPLLKSLHGRCIQLSLDQPSLRYALAAFGSVSK